MPARVFSDWSRPLLPALAEWLLDGAAGPGAPDLSGTLVIVPTAEAARRLRRKLAHLAGETGLLTPDIITPEALISRSIPEETPVAGRGESITAWAAVLASLELDDWRALFPVDPVNQDAAWALRTAMDLLRLRRTLEEGARSLGMATADLGKSHPEGERWEALAALERLAVARLEAGGWRDSTLVRLAAARRPHLPEGITRVILAGMPDSLRLTRAALEAVEEQGTVEVVTLIHAPPPLADSFDAWGRPLPAVWTRRPIRLPRGSRTVTLLPRPEDEAAAIAAQWSGTGIGRGPQAMGTADPETAPPLRRRLEKEGLVLFDPEGTPLLEHEVSWLIRTLAALLHTGAWSAAGHLLRIPDVLRAACTASGTGSGSGAALLLRHWDEFQAARLPQTLEQAFPLAGPWAEERHARHLAAGTRNSPDDLKKPALPAVLAWLAGETAKLEQGPLTESLEAFLKTVYGHRCFATAAERQRFTAALTAWQEALESVTRGAGRFLPQLGAATRLDLAADLVKDARLHHARGEEDLTLQGWLELPWEEAPHLTVAGLNEGLVPDSIQGDAWLPDSVRARLDLKTNDTRLARDSYLLTAMIESRRAHGSVHLLAARETSAGDPLKPSRLLLRCPSTDLPERALHLFPREPEDSSARSPVPSWRRAWTLAVPPPPEEAPVFRRLSVTAFADYLKCPFRFYLKHVLGMEEYDAALTELDARAFGSLFHDTMQALHLNTALRDCTDAAVLTSFLHAGLERNAGQTYGGSLTIPVALQLDTLRRTLAKAAELHAAERAAGWRFEEVEIDFPTLPGSDEPVRISGVEIRGRIDLIERHPERGLRILDYKTSAKAVRPAAAHLKPVRKTDPEEPAWKSAEAAGRPCLWQNLQLPLYASIMSRHYGQPVAAGYVNLPRALGEARVEMWEDLDAGLLESAEDCARGVITAIRNARFWPPADQVGHDDFRSLIFDSARWSFDPRQLERAAAMADSGQFRPAP